MSKNDRLRYWGLLSLFLFAQARPATAATWNVLDQGAVINDGADDLGAIQTAIGKASAGDTIYLPQGEYEINGSILLGSGMVLAGDGASQTRVVFIGANPAPMIQLAAGVSHTEVKALTLDANHSAFAQAGINASSSSGHFFHDLTIIDFDRTGDYGPLGVSFSSAVTDSIVSNNVMTSIGPTSEWGGGIRMSWGSSSNQILNNRISGTGRGGIFCDNMSTDLKIQHNTISGSGGSGLGIELWGGCDRALVEDNSLDHWLSLGGASETAVRRNTIHDPSGTVKAIGIELATGQRDIVVTDNTVDGGQQVGISVSNTGAKENVYWGHNTIKGMLTWGAQIQGEVAGANYHYFYANTFSGTLADNSRSLYPNQGHGFRFNENCAYIILDANQIVGNGGGGIQLSDQLNNIIVRGNQISQNVLSAFFAPSSAVPGLQVIGNTISGNGDDSLPTTSADAAGPPAIALQSSLSPSGQRTAHFSFSYSSPSGAPIQRVLWDFGDGLPATDFWTTHTYPASGTYRVTLIVWDSNGNASLVERNLSIP